MMYIPHDLYGRSILVALFCVLIVIGVELSRQPRPEPSAMPHPELARGDLPVPDHLTVHVGDVDLSAVPLRGAIRLLGNRAQANLDGDWSALRWSYSAGVEEAAITTTQPVTLHLHDPTLAEALNGICQSINLPSDQVLGIARDPADILMLGVAEENGRQRSVTTLPQFYNVDDLIGPAARFLPGSRHNYEGTLYPHGARAELQALAKTLDNFAGPGQVYCFGRWLMVNGYLEAQENVAAVLDGIRHPIRLSTAAMQVLPATPPATQILGELPPIPVFRVPPTGMSGRQVLEKWEEIGAGHGVVELQPGDFDLLQDVVGFELRNASLEQIAEQIVGSPFVVIPRGQEDDRVHIRRGRDPQLRLDAHPRAYDVSAILAHPSGWIENARSNVGPRENLRSNEDLLIQLVSAHVDLQRGGRLPWDRELVACWHGILLVQQEPAIQEQIVRFLEHLERTGRPDDPPADQ